MRTLGLALTFAAVLLSGTLLGCGPKAVRGEEVAGLDDQAMGTGLDRRDLERLLHDNMAALQASAVVKRWQTEDRPTLAVLPLRNETSEHVESALEALASDIETQLVNAGHVRLISREMQSQLMAEVQKQQSGTFDKETITRWGQQAGARYFVTGKVFSSDEMFDGERRVQYYLFMQVLDVATSDVLFQNKSALTKAIVR
jgi:penicillin-binding protein activator